MADLRRSALFRAYMLAHGYTETTPVTSDHVYLLLQELRAAEQALFDLSGGAQGCNWPRPEIENSRRELTQ